jgi:hypothetical protein
MEGLFCDLAERVLKLVLVLIWRIEMYQMVVLLPVFWWCEGVRLAAVDGSLLQRVSDLQFISYYLQSVTSAMA